MGITINSNFVTTIRKHSLIRHSRVTVKVITASLSAKAQSESAKGGNDEIKRVL